MRRGIVLAVLACASATARADGDSGGAPLPAAAQPLATRLEAAVDGNKLKPFLALVPAKLQVDSATTTRAQLKKAIRAAGSLDDYLLGTSTPMNLGGGWTEDLREDGTIEVVANGITFLLVRRKRHWHLASIERIGTDSIAPTAVLSGALTIVGGLTKEAIHDAVAQRSDAFAYCYEKLLAQNAKAAGTVLVDFVIDADGKVQTASGTGFDAGVSNCVTGVLEQIRFPKPKGGGTVQVHYPFVFKPASE